MHLRLEELTNWLQTGFEVTVLRALQPQMHNLLSSDYVTSNPIYHSKTGL
jgi:hypothetical protein